MRINCSITLHNRIALWQFISAVNEQRQAMGLEPATQSEVVNEIIARAAERSTINLCNVFITREQRESQSTDREASSEAFAINDNNPLKREA